ncbi:hypothetical protein PAXRUDRAFT_96833, partial [Paxillus rubicundulus Ve08.2h10]
KPLCDYTNADLLVPADSRWKNNFLDTVILCAGSQEDIWVIPYETMASALHKIFNVVYPDVEYRVTTQGAVFGVAYQCLGSWHTAFMSAALAMEINFFSSLVLRDEEDLDTKESDECICELVSELIQPPSYPLINEDHKNPDPAHNFQSPFILQLIATSHLTSIANAVNVPTLGTKNLSQGHGMEGIISTATAAV